MAGVDVCWQQTQMMKWIFDFVAGDFDCGWFFSTSCNDGKAKNNLKCSSCRWLSLDSWFYCSWIGLVCHHGNKPWNVTNYGQCHANKLCVILSCYCTVYLKVKTRQYLDYLLQIIFFIHILNQCVAWSVNKGFWRRSHILYDIHYVYIVLHSFTMYEHHWSTFMKGSNEWMVLKTFHNWVCQSWLYLRTYTAISW